MVQSAFYCSCSSIITSVCNKPEAEIFSNFHIPVVIQKYIGYCSSCLYLNLRMGVYMKYTSFCYVTAWQVVERKMDASLCQKLGNNLFETSSAHAVLPWRRWTNVFSPYLSLLHDCCHRPNVFTETQTHAVVSVCDLIFEFFLLKQTLLFSAFFLCLP
jgi:hypothetical protein